jgi:3-hydroxyisobutyrate dehydrogenase-like beta-hydroxyacid dehydrogenase
MDGMFRKQRISVGIIGLGIIGARAAGNLRRAGFQVSVWNRTPKPEPNFLGSPAEVAEASEVIQLFVADPKAVHDVLDAIGEALTEKHTVLCSATVGPEATLEIAKRVQERGAKFLDAPFTGSKAAAEKGQLVYYIGGDSAILQAVRPVLEATSKAIVEIGEIGHAATIKVVTNVLSAVTVETLAEMLAVVKAAGIAPEKLTAALEHHGIRSGITDMKLPKMIEGDYEPHFSLKHMLKDVQFGENLADKLKLDLPATAATADAMRDGVEKGWAELDFASVMKRYTA